MKSNKYILLIILVVFNIANMMADFLPPQPGDPGYGGGGGMSVPLDGGIIMGLLAGASLVTVLFKRKKKDE